eukprot:CAMPEP_0168438330 /NCGR_PEP_ID=MMETSP0228-20121227/41905_1 /TAXON_ID=133427 /ORGANISM="Protoceratium reticulatum, Strain CCCM 535 (=CCMP 1889)" /LENGTH=156 /DNA_ID=CAMNT_0008452593 /DNA_START=78 /DNA_END=545 /DNA_ORIENTATION=-
MQSAAMAAGRCSARAMAAAGAARRAPAPRAGQGACPTARRSVHASTPRTSSDALCALSFQACLPFGLPERLVAWWAVARAPPSPVAPCAGMLAAWGSAIVADPPADVPSRLQDGETDGETDDQCAALHALSGPDAWGDDADLLAAVVDFSASPAWQ